MQEVFDNNGHTVGIGDLVRLEGECYTVTGFAPDGRPLVAGGNPVEPELLEFVEAGSARGVKDVFESRFGRSRGEF